MANLGAVVILTTEWCITGFSAAKTGVVQVVDGAGDLFLFLSAVAFMLQGLLALLALASMTFQLTAVNSTVQRFCTDFLAHNLILLAALHRSRGSSTATTSLNHCLARGTWSRMAEQSTGMLTQLLTPTQLPTRMRNVAAVVLRIFLFSTEAVIIAWDLF